MNSTGTIAKTLIGMLTVAACTTVYATESGGSAYAHGAETWMPGFLPPPGDYYLNYTNYYRADKLNGPDGDTLIDDFEVEAFANVFRYVHVTNKKILGGNYAFQILVPLVDLHVSSSGRSDRRSGLGDITIDPFILGWHLGKLHVVAGIDFILPTGGYDRDRLANIGRNYYTIEPAMAVTYHDPGGMELSTKLMYDVSTENESTDYQSGDEFHMDFAAGWNVSAWTLGLSGYYDKQLSDDEQYGRRLAGGNRGEVLALGPSAKYQWGNISLIAAWQQELEATNRPQGNKLWFNFVLPLEL
ncbi:SphA family protein [Pseudomonas umsongensis]|uniref:SphA family protein n=1 Tax=Pseudomonas umsongensis TaxID=198618 RepID=UPI00200A9994|nr:transporter [Pseudomonas umsongensis]MCK8681847.1 transporter [Pseudomonas umsongensis]